MAEMALSATAEESRQLTLDLGDVETAASQAGVAFGTIEEQLSQLDQTVPLQSIETQLNALGETATRTTDTTNTLGQVIRRAFGRESGANASRLRDTIGSLAGVGRRAGRTFTTVAAQVARAFGRAGQSAVNGFRERLRRLNQESRQTQNSFSSIRQLFGLAFGAFTIREVGRTSDGYTNLQNRIRLVTDAQQELFAVQDALVGVAQRTRTSLTAVGELYGRVARSTEALGATQTEVLEFTESVSQAIQISGATAQEASAGVIQFAQGLAAGALRGDELRSVLEQTPRLASAIADSLGVTIGDLRTLGQEGELTAERVFQAVLDAGPELEREFALITPTVQQTATTIANFATTVIGNFNEASGVTQGLVDIFQLTDEETLSLAQTVRDLGLAFREFVEVATVAVANFVDTVPTRFAQLRADIAGTLGVIFGNDELIEAAIADRNQFIGEIDAVRQRLDDEFDLIRRNTEARREALAQREADLNARRGDGGPAVPEIDAQTIDRQAAFIEGLRRQAAELAIQTALGEDAEATLRIYTTALDAAAIGNDDFVRRAVAAAEAVNEQAQAFAEAQRRASDVDVIAALETELQLLELTARERVQEAALRQLSAEATVQQRDAVRELAGELFDEQQRLSEQADFLESLSDQAARNIQSAFADFLFDPFADGLDGLVRNFSDALRRMAAEALAAQIFENLFPTDGAGGGLGALLFGFFGGQRQFGGGVRTDQTYLVGERGPELFRPAVAGNIVPNNQLTAPNVQVEQAGPTIINTIDDRSIVAAFNRGGGGQVILNNISENRAAYRQALGI